MVYAKFDIVVIMVSKERKRNIIQVFVIVSTKTSKDIENSWKTC